MRGDDRSSVEVYVSHPVKRFK